jgi:chemotaxis protein CheY-P-specific phosphatase CheC
LTGKEMLISFKDVMQFPSGDELVKHCVNQQEEQFFGSLIKVRSGLAANIVFLIAEPEGLGLYDLLNGQSLGTTTTATDDVTVAMGEINNILSASFVNNLAAMTGKEIHPSTPFNSHDMLEALMEGVVTEEEIAGRRVFCADTVIAEKDKKEFHARLLIIADHDGLKRLISATKAA